MRYCLLILVLLLHSTTTGHSQTKSPLRVLLVGHNPAHPQPAAPGQMDERKWELYRERTPAFTQFLKQHFDSVTTVYAADYDSEQSAAADVTLFDAKPTSPQGANALPLDFSHPAVLIGEASPAIGATIGLKFDWL